MRFLGDFSPELGAALTSLRHGAVEKDRKKELPLRRRVAAEGRKKRGERGESLSGRENIEVVKEKTFL